MAQLGISVSDAYLFDVDTYTNIVELQQSVYSQLNGNRKATQEDIDKFLL